MTVTPLLEALRNVTADSRPVAFWFLNHFLREDELRRQVRDIAEKGFGGIMFHARDGLRSGYLNGEWRQALAWSLDEAVRHGLRVWLYDELNYPTGPAGGRMFDHLPESRMQSLEWLPPATLKPRETVSVDTAGRAVRYAWVMAPDGRLESVPPESALAWTNATDHDVTVLLLVEERDLAEAYKFPDPLDPKATATFVELSYEWYAKEFGRYFGPVIRGEFTDNSCFSFGLVRRAIPWTPDLPERFVRKTGRDLADVLPSLFLKTPGHKESRLLFWKFIGDEYLESFVIPIDRSCRKNGIPSTGHYCLEQAGAEHIRQLGDRFDQKRHQGLPAVDMLGIDDKARMRDLLRTPGVDALSVAIPGTASAAYFHKNSRVMCECLGLAGGWGLDLAEVQRITGLLAVLGIDLFVPHGVYYSIAGHRKWESWPDHRHNPMWTFYREWADWIAKVCTLTSHGERTSQTALLYPSTAQRAYVELGVEPTRGKAYKMSDRGAVCDLIDFTWVAAGNALLENNIAYEIIDETLIQSARIEDGRLLIPAANGTELAVTVLVLPCAKILGAKTLDKLRQWRASGGHPILLNSEVEESYDAAAGTLTPVASDPPLAAFRLDFESERDLAAKAGPLFDFIRRKTCQPIEASGHGGKLVSRHWRKWNCDFYMLHNVSEAALTGIDVVLRGDHVPCRLNLETLAFEAVDGRRNGNAFSFRCDVTPAQSLILAAGPGIGAPEPSRIGRPASPVERLPVNGEWEFSALGPNVLPLRSCTLEVRRAVKRYVYRFNVEAPPGRLGVAVDCEMRDMELRFDRYLSSRMKCFMNGVGLDTLPSGKAPATSSRAPWVPKCIESLRPGQVFDRWIFEADVTGLVKAGENEWVIELTSGLLDENRGCDMPLLFGDFILAGVPGAERIAPAGRQTAVGDWRRFGYPYYAGMGAYRTRIQAPPRRPGTRWVLSLGDLANAAEVLVNGTSAGRRILPPWEFDLSACAGMPDLDLEVRVINTPKNLWDPDPRPSGLFGPVEWRAFT